MYALAAVQAALIVSLHLIFRCRHSPSILEILGERFLMIDRWQKPCGLKLFITAI